MGDREQFWQTHVDACRVSGDTQKTYCERHGITPKTLRTWQARLAGAPALVATTDGDPHGGDPHEGDPHEGEARGGAKEIFSPSSGVPSDRAQAMDLFTNPRVRRTWTLEQRQQIVIDALRSGLSIERFARMSGLTPSVVHRWKQELAVRVGHSPDRLQHPAAAPRFASVHVAPAPSEPAPRASSNALVAPAHDTVEVVLTNGRRVRLHAQMDAKVLHDLLAVLERGA
jgi:transposase